MATKKQLIPLLMEDIRRYSPELLDDETFSLHNDEDFRCVVEDLLWDRGLCHGCKHWFSAERTCENPSDSMRTCVNRAYEYLLKENVLRKSE